MDCLNWYWWLLVFYFVHLFPLRLHHILFLAIQYLEHVSDSLHIFVCMHPVYFLVLFHLFLQVWLLLLPVCMNILLSLHSLHSLPSLASQILVHAPYSRYHSFLLIHLSVWFLLLLVFYFVHSFLKCHRSFSILAIQCLEYVSDIGLFHYRMYYWKVWFLLLLISLTVLSFLQYFHLWHILAIQYLGHVYCSLHLVFVWLLSPYMLHSFHCLLLL